MDFYETRKYLFNNSYTVLEYYGKQTERLCQLLLTDCTRQSLDYHIKVFKVISEAIFEFLGQSNGFSGTKTVSCRTETDRLIGYNSNTIVHKIIPSILCDSEPFTYKVQEKDSERSIAVTLDTITGLIRVKAHFGVTEYGFPDVSVPLFAWYPGNHAIGMTPFNLYEFGIPLDKKSHIKDSYESLSIEDFKKYYTEAHKYLGSGTIDFLDDTRYNILKIINSAVRKYNEQLATVEKNKDCLLDDM